MNEYFRALARRWSEKAAERGVRVSAPELDPAVADEILQLARVVAHSKERSFAPLASFMAGVAIERFRVLMNADAATQATLLREVREELERETGADRA